MEPKVNRMSFSLGKEHQQLLREITAKSGRSATSELRILINLRASELGLTPVAPAATKRMRKTKKVE